MEIVIDSVKIDKEKITALVKIEGLMKEIEGDKYSYGNSLAGAVQRSVIDALTEKFLLDNMAKILTNVDLQAVINAVTMNVAQKINGRI